MSLSVQLSRAGDEPWGFRLIGGVDFNVPLTVVKVLPNSPADRAGLENGDTVSSIAGKDARSMTHEESRMAVALAEDELELGVTRGLYDPVLDDYEPIYEPIDQDDFDQPSQPTEVQFSLQNFPDIIPNGREYSLPKDFDPKLSESRSLTASPFVIPTKPYRPFSTEPVPEIPSLEDPIILNPKYHDDFGTIDDEFLPKTRFKLPISEQYDPDGTKGKVARSSVGVIEDRSDLKSVEIDETMKKEVMTREEVMFLEEMKQAIDVNMIEMTATQLIEKNVENTATSIVDESIQKAVTVAEEIKKEIDVELRESATRDLNSEQIIEQSSSKTKISIPKVDIQVTEQKTEVKETVTAVNELVGLKDKATHEVIKQNGDISLSERMVTQKIDDAKDIKNQQTAYQKVYEHDTQVKHEEKKIADDAYIKSEKDARVKSEIHAANTSQQSKNTSDAKSTTGKTTTKSFTKSEAKQRAYMIGLQTIPNIRGSVHSSYHYNLLLKTFFVHLTDVMVALTGFILSEHPVLENEQDNHGSKETLVKETVSKASEFSEEKTEYEAKADIQSGVIQRERVENEVASKVQKEAIVKSQFQKEDDTTTKVKSLVVDEVVEKRKLSGSKMAQMTEKKGEDFIYKMDAVVSEFQTKAGIEEPTTTEETHLSEEQNMSIEASFMESSESNKRVETREKRSKSKEGNNTYIAIVESHVYTNKDFAVDAFSETSSVQSTDEKKLSAELGEALATETVALETFKVAEESAQILQESHELASVHKESAIEVSQDAQMSTKVVEETQATTESSFVQERQVKAVQETTSSKEKAVTEVTELQTITKVQDIKNAEFLEQTQAIKEEVQESKKAETVEQTKSVKEEIQESQMLVTEEVHTNKKSSIVDNVSEPIEYQVLDEQETKVLETETAIIKDELLAIAETTETIFEEKSSEVEQKYGTTEKYEQKDIVVIDESLITKSEDTKSIVNDKSSTEFVATLQQSKIAIKKESASLKVAKEQVTEVEKSIETSEDTHFSVKQQIEVTAQEQTFESFEEMRTFDSVTEETKESTFVAKSVTFKEPELEKLSLRTDLPLKRETSVTDIDTPTPSTIPPTPMTDEYIFKLEIPLPKLVGPPVPNDPSPERDEDPHIVKKGLIPQIDSPTIESRVFDPPLASPLASPTEKMAPVYTKPGLKGGAARAGFRREEIQEIERKSSLLASAIDQTIRSIEEYKEEVGIESLPVIYNGYSTIVETKIYDTKEVNTKRDNNKEVKTKGEKMDDVTCVEINLEGYRPVQFDLDEIQRARSERSVSRQREIPPAVVCEPKVYMSETGEVLGTHQGIVDSLEQAVVDEEVAKELGKPGMTEDKIAELISGESEMLREAHVMGLSRVLTSHMSRPDDSSVDFKKIKPIVESLKDSEVLKALNDEFTKTREEKKKEERKWTKFLQKPKRPVPRIRFGYPGWSQEEEKIEEPYKVKIVKQPKPKVAPDYKSEDFETGPLPWEERALNEPPPPPVEAEDPILVPEETPEFLEAVDPLPESEVPDLEDTGIPLPQPKPIEEEKEQAPIEAVEEITEEPPTEVLETVVEETEKNEEEMDQNRIAEQIMTSVQNMVDPNAPLEQQLSQMRAQLAALAQLPCVIQQTLELVTRQLSQLSHPEHQSVAEVNEIENNQQTENMEVTQNENQNQIIEESPEQPQVESQQSEGVQIVEVTENSVEQNNVTQEEMVKLKREEEEMLEEQRRLEKQKKELMEQMQQEQEARQLKQRPTPRVGKPKPMFGPLTPQERPVVLPGGRRWRNPKDAYNEQFFAETLSAQAELIQGKTKGLSFESVLLPYDERINFLKYEKPPVSLDHLQNSDVYKLIHNMEQSPCRRVEMLTPVVCEADYIEKCRSMTPCVE